MAILWAPETTHRRASNEALHFLIWSDLANLRGPAQPQLISDQKLRYSPVWMKFRRNQTNCSNVRFKIVYWHEGQYFLVRIAHYTIAFAHKGGLVWILPAGVIDVQLER